MRKNKNPLNGKCTKTKVPFTVPFFFIFLLLSVFICVYLWLRFYLRLHAPRRERIARAASLARSPRSPTGPTHEGHPFSQGHAAISSRVFASRMSWARYSGSENPIPPGYAS